MWSLMEDGPLFQGWDSARLVSSLTAVLADLSSNPVGCVPDRVRDGSAKV
jgi:hypothetical protein